MQLLDCNNIADNEGNHGSEGGERRAFGANSNHNPALDNKGGGGTDHNNPGDEEEDNNKLLMEGRRTGIDSNMAGRSVGPVQVSQLMGPVQTCQLMGPSQVILQCA